MKLLDCKARDIVRFANQAGHVEVLVLRNEG